MRSILVIWLLILPALAHAQYTISGNIINLYDKKPVAKASVFLSNTTIGTASADDGSYLLRNVKPGQYDMVITAIGYETLYKTIKVEQTLNIPYIELTPKTVELNAVVVKPDPEWQNNYRIFKDELLGPSDYALQCKILNPEILDLNFDKAKRTLTASTNDYLEVENKALGYKLKYLLTNFIKDYHTASLYYQGNVLFIPMQGKPSQVRKWYKNRLEAYMGSSQHYLRSLLGNQLMEQGFRSMRLIRKPNLQRPPDSLIQAKIAKYGSAAISIHGNSIIMQKKDSLDYWLERKRMPKIVETLVTAQLNVDSLIKKTDQKGIFAIGFQDVLYIVYNKKKGHSNYDKRPLNAPDFPTSLMNFSEPYAFFDTNGIIVNPTSVVFEGDWGSDRLAKLLPYDYDPKEKENGKP
ncbi:carboxypeptidase-like regulatory domain-containing protein [Mucilaginibacter sp. PAMB04274]|uniref:carboxypeptidase-like regulatory domain-containing protein n=1 Tax=Mucilaginibacter sp. PAMB04274 TaxID=3138568 RepID=UPI0031F64A78